MCNVFGEFELFVYFVIEKPFAATYLLIKIKSSLYALPSKMLSVDTLNVTETVPLKLDLVYLGKLFLLNGYFTHFNFWKVWFYLNQLKSIRTWNYVVLVKKTICSMKKSTHFYSLTMNSCEMVYEMYLSLMHQHFDWRILFMLLRKTTLEKCWLTSNHIFYRLDSELRKWIDAYPIDNTTHSTSKGTKDFKNVPWPLSFSSPQNESKRPLKKKVPINPTLYVFDGAFLLKIWISSLNLIFS